MINNLIIILRTLLIIVFFTIAGYKLSASIQRRKGPNVIRFLVPRAFADGLTCNFSSYNREPSIPSKYSVFPRDFESFTYNDWLECARYDAETRRTVEKAYKAESEVQANVLIAVLGGALEQNPALMDCILNRRYEPQLNVLLKQIRLIFVQTSRDLLTFYRYFALYGRDVDAIKRMEGDEFFTYWWCMVEYYKSVNDN